MPTSSYTKVQDYAEQLNKAVHNWSAHTFKLAASASSIAATVAVFASVTEISAGNGYTAGGMTMDTVSLSETGGTASLTIADEVLTASGGAIANFRYLYFYNDTPTSPADPGVAIFDYGSTLTLANTESLTVDFGATVWTFA